MKFLPKLAPVICLICLVSSDSAAFGQFKQDSIVRESIDVFDEIMAIPANGIPAAMLKNAHAVAIVPRVIKGSFVVGARHGKGVVLIRDENGAWHAPVFISLTGGNVGWQIGVQSTDVILVFKTKQSVTGLLSGKFTLGADAAVAAGPVGRKAAAATDDRLAAEILSYSRSRGLFAGVSIDGSVIKVDQMGNSKYYRATTPGGPVVVPDAAQQLANQVLRYTGVLPSANAAFQQRNVANAQQQPILAEQHSKAEVAHVRDELAKFAPELYELLDNNWKTYLALPAEVFQGKGHPSLDALNQSLARFEVVRAEQRYATLANHPEFQSTYGLLKHYVQELSKKTSSLDLPAPPTPRVGRQ